VRKRAGCSRVFTGQATALEFKADLYQAILKVAKNCSQKRAAKNSRRTPAACERAAQWQDRYKRVDKLLYYAGRLGIEARAKFAQTHKEIIEKELAVADTAGDRQSLVALAYQNNRDSTGGSRVMGAADSAPSFLELFSFVLTG
jgi:hypothetical protein